MNGLFSTVELAQVAPTSTLPLCGKCGLYKTCLSPKMSPTGRGKRGILIVAEAPGEQEDRRGVQLVGNSGRHLEESLRRHGVELRYDCTLTNAVVCRPPNNKLPSENVVDHCRPNLVRTVREVRPKLIITLGESALRSVAGAVWGEPRAKIGRWYGWRVPVPEWNCWVCPTWHPAYLLRAKDPVLDLYHDKHLRAACSLTGRPWDGRPGDPARRVTVVVDPDEAADRVADMVARGGDASFDFETDRLKPDEPDSRIVACGICMGGEETIAFPWAGRAVKAVGRFLASDRVRKFGWNVKFEERWALKEFGRGVANWAVCGMTATHVLDNRPNVTSLKFQARVRLGAGDYAAGVKPYLKPKDGGGNSPNRVAELCRTDRGLELLLLYCGLDALYEYRLGTKLGRGVLP